MLLFEDVRFGDALQGVSLRVDAGEIVAVRGEKRGVLLRVAAGVESPDSGSVSSTGCVAVVNDSWPAMGGPTVVDQLMLSLLETTSIRRSRALAVRCLIEHGAEDWAALDLRELDAGERARLAVLRALIARPGVVLAENPTAVEGELEQLAIIDLLKTAARNGAAVLVTAGSTMVLGAAHRTLMLSHGTLIEPLPATEAEVIRFPRAGSAR